MKSSRSAFGPAGLWRVQINEIDFLGAAAGAELGASSLGTDDLGQDVLARRNRLVPANAVL